MSGISSLQSEPEHGKRILLAEDSVVQRLSLSAMLAHHGYHVDHAENGEEALRLLESVTTMPDLIITDLGMPHMNGLNLCRRIKQDPKTWHVPVIMLTSLGDEKNHDLGLDAGAADFVTKPVTEQELIYRVNLAVTSAADSRESQRGWYGVIFDALAQGVLVTDEHGCFRDANPALLELIGFSRHELGQLPDESLILEPKNWAEVIRPTVAEAGVWCGRVQLRNKTGASDLIDARATAASLARKPVYVWLLAATSSEPPRLAKAVGNMSKTTANPSQYKPEQIVDAGRLYEMIGLRSGDPASLTQEESDRLCQFTAAVENAAAVRRIHRVTKLDPKTGQVIGRGYVRDELDRIIRNRG